MLWSWLCGVLDEVVENLTVMGIMGRSMNFEHFAVAGTKCDSAVRDSMQGEHGVRRALLESVVRLSCRDSVTADLATILEPLPEDELPSYQLTHELYGSTRMLLACLTKEQLAQVGFFLTNLSCRDQVTGSMQVRCSVVAVCCCRVLKIACLVLCRSAAAGVVTWRRCWRL